MKPLTHKDLRKLGFNGNKDEGYVLGNVRIDSYEGKDERDFLATIDGIVYGWMETFEQLEEALETNLINED